MKKMKTQKIEATYRVTTPLFCGGAGDQAELRVPSFKGVLRFWWRALAWSRLGGNLADIKAAEDRLFGSASGGQSKVRMHLGEHDEKGALKRPAILKDGNDVVGQGARYLGYGVMEAFHGKNTEEGRLNKSCLPAPFDFTVQLRCRGLCDDEEPSLLAALKALGLFGAMGAKSRKGYGSLSLTALTLDGAALFTQPTDAGALRATLAALVPTLAAPAPRDYKNLPAYTAFHSEARVLVVDHETSALKLSGATSALALLDAIGKEEVRYRSWGRKRQHDSPHKILGGEKAEQNFDIDHGLIRNCAKPEWKGKHPQRIVFGLPHTAAFSPADKHFDRRASPLLIHIHYLPDGQHVGVLTFLPALFLPKGKDRIGTTQRSVPLVGSAELYAPMHTFLDRFTEDNPTDDNPTNEVNPHV